MTEKLSANQIKERLAELDGWTFADDSIRREFKFNDFAEAFTFVTRVGAVAEERNHHPDIDVRFDTVTLALTSHDAGGLTERDFAFAAAVDGFSA